MVARSCWIVAGIAGLLLVSACTNDPYPDTDRGKKVLYSSFNEAPKTLDPAVAYTTAEHVITGNVYDTLLEYHYLKRPYRLIPGLAEAVPEPQQHAGRPPVLSLQDPPGHPLPRRSLLCAEPGAAADPGGCCRRLRLRSWRASPTRPSTAR